MNSEISPGDNVYVLTVFCGENPGTWVNESTVHSLIPGYGILRRIGDTFLTARSEDVFKSKMDADVAAAARLRAALAKISRAYEERIAEVESNGT